MVNLPAACGEWSPRLLAELGGINPWFLMESIGGDGEVAAFTNGQDVIMLFAKKENTSEQCGVLFKNVVVAPMPKQSEAQQ